MLTIIPNKDTLNPTLSTNINLSSITPSATCSYTEPNSLVTGCVLTACKKQQLIQELKRPQH